MILIKIIKQIIVILTHVRELSYFEVKIGFHGHIDEWFYQPDTIKRLGAINNHVKHGYCSSHVIHNSTTVWKKYKRIWQ